MKIKIEIDSGMISPREYAVRTIAKEIVKTGIKEKQIWYNEAALSESWRICLIFSGR